MEFYLTFAGKKNNDRNNRINMYHNSNINFV